MVNLKFADTELAERVNSFVSKLDAMTTPELEALISGYVQQGIVSRSDIVFTIRYYRMNMSKDFSSSQRKVINSFLVKKLFHVVT